MLICHYEIYFRHTSRAERFKVRLIALSIGLLSSMAINPGIASPLSENLLMAQTTSITGDWRLVSITESETPTPMLPPQTTELTASFADDRVSGSGGCNRFMGGYQTEGNQLSIGPLASTFRACEETVLNQEVRYLAALQGVQRYEVDDQGLALFYETEQGSGVLRFTAQTVRGLW